SSQPTIAVVSATGIVTGRSDGTAEVVVTAGSHKRTVPVRVTGAAQVRHLHFENDIIPLLSRFGCNSSGCHGKAEGQNGFKLSVFAPAPPADYAALVKESRGRRVLPAIPDLSLLLTKPSGAIAHGGGIRIPRGSPEYETLRAWITAGMPVGDPKAP